MRFFGKAACLSARRRWLLRDHDLDDGSHRRRAAEH